MSLSVVCRTHFQLWKGRIPSFITLLSLSEEAISSLFTLPPHHQMPCELCSMNATVDKS